MNGCCVISAENCGDFNKRYYREEEIIKRLKFKNRLFFISFVSEFYSKQSNFQSHSIFTTTQTWNIFIASSFYTKRELD